MADKHPYVSASGNLVQVINHFRKSFPGTVTADTMKKLGFAPKNESYVLNVLRFLGLIDKEGNKTELASRIFSLHDDPAFSKEFEKLVTKAYKDLFDLHGDSAWQLDAGKLISFFRQADESTDLVGKLQAKTFQALAGLSGHGALPESKPRAPKPLASPSKKSVAKPRNVARRRATALPETQSDNKRPSNFGLTVRIEINLPADGDQETYNRIFRSIRENLLNE